ncbi:hypothetical protein DLREEDagrD3_21910 [Denitratisoma sp. agr-D3]
MKISAANIELNASHSYFAKEQTSTSLETWVTATPAKQQASQAALVSVSDAGQSLANQQVQLSAAQEAASKDPLLQLLLRVVESITGQPIHLLFFTADAESDSPSVSVALPADGQVHLATTGEVATPVRLSTGMRYEYSHSYEENETTQVSAEGTVRTTDGQEIKLSLGLTMNRSYREESQVSIEVGAKKRQDPLVINFAGTAAQLRDQRFSFDLNSDGNKESLAQLGWGSGYLAFDRNGNGRIDNGQELFGPATNSGFGELAQLDSDHNGWIDENDDAYGKLSVWTPDENGEGRLQSLASLQVGALYTGHVASPFELRGRGNSDLGAVNATGLFLREDGSSGTLQELDLTV